MRRRLTVLAAGLAVAAGLAAPAPAADFRPLGAYVESLPDGGKRPGASVLVLRNGRELFYAQAGMADLEAGRPIRRDTLFRVYSMTKPVTAAAVMILVDEGKLRLDDPVTNYIPEFRELRVFKGMDGDRMLTDPAGPMTVENLLTHTAGFSYAFQSGPVASLYKKTPLAGDVWRFDPAFKGGDAFARTLAGLPLVAQPGERWHYSMALDVAALVVQRASGVAFETFARDRIFRPLGMDDTGFSVPPEKAHRLASLYQVSLKGGLQKTDDGATSPLLHPLGGFSGGAGLVSTIDDYARFARMLADGGTGNGRRILSRPAVAAMMTNHLTPAQLGEMKATAAFGLGGQGEGLGFGYGGAVVTSTAALGGLGSVGEYAWGGAASTTFWIDPMQKVIVIFMTQVIPPMDRIRDHLRERTYTALSAPHPRK
ncbi:MAG: beta-lactamase family protein [Phenylobacterium sp.]|uniref:serine hydrolase domain-containing protein n=1 Tax=Phenylobacterium sp. TaxID=1871053 RepID=UPI001A402932|nr:serine hydrolase domain-containing protein [Phenylobacterium sp.]MBL8771005.1 beta-lactamase family protein [Phenylobacterium sp.]